MLHRELASVKHVQIARAAFLGLLGVTDECRIIDASRFRAAYEDHPRQMDAIFGIPTDFDDTDSDDDDIVNSRVRYVAFCVC